MANATFDRNEVYPIRLNARESKVVEVAIANSNGATRVADETARLALPPSDGNLVVQLDNDTLYVYDLGTSTWIQIGSGGGGGGSPGSPNQAIQFNNGGAFGGSASLKWDGSQVNMGGLKIEPLGVDTLSDNQSGVVLFTFAHAVERFVVVEYSISRGSEARIGHLKVACNGVTATLDDIYVNTADVGVTFSAIVNGANIEIKYSTTSLGVSALMKSSKRKWI